MEENIFLRWKSRLQTKNKRKQLETLQDIVNFFNNDQEKKKNNYVRFINQDLSYFLSEMLIYHHKIQTNLVIKIICHISEVPEFYKSDFFRYIRSGLRLINSFSKDCISDHDKNEADYKRNILNVNTIMLKRALKFNVKDSGGERIPKISLIIMASTLTCLDSKIPEKLDFINAILDMLSPQEVDANNKAYQELKLIEITKNLRFTKHDLLNDDYFVPVSIFFCKLIAFLSDQPNHAAEGKIIINLVVDKFLAIMRFVLLDADELSNLNYEIFLNLIYYIFKSSSLSSIKYVILNYFLTLNGLGFLIILGSSKDDKIAAFKSRVVLAEIMVHILNFFLKVEDNDECTLDSLRWKYLEITHNCDFSPQDVSIYNIDELSKETLMFVIFKYFVMIKWNKMKKSRGELLSTMAFIIEVFKARKAAMDKGLISMMCYIYTTNFVHISLKSNDLLENSSATLLKYAERINVIIDFNFFKWWFLQNWKNRATYEKIINFMISPKSCENFMDLCQDDLFAFDLKFLLQSYLNENIPIENTFKLTRIICYMSINLHDIGKLFKLYEKQRSEKDRRKSINVLKILCANKRKLSPRLMRLYCELAKKTLKQCENIEERILICHILANLFNTEKR